MSRRIVIIGNAGGGKTTLALRLAAKSGLPLYHTDSWLWNPGWQPTPEAEFEIGHDVIMNRPEWIIDGLAYASALERRIALADQIVLIDFPLWHHYYWAMKRQISSAFRPRPEMPADCPMLPKTFELIRLMKTVHDKMRPRWLELLEQYKAEKEIVVIHTRREWETFAA